MHRQTLFAITYNSDSTEGRGPTLTLGYAKSQELAVQIVTDPRFKKYSVWGVHSAIDAVKYNVKETELIIFETVDEAYVIPDEQTRQRALEKLTAEERRVLGL